MPDRIRIACVQLTASADKAANLARAERLVARAASLGADVIALPEKWNGVGNAEQLHALAEPLEGGESVAALSRWAQTHGVSIVAGSVTERREGHEKLSNTSIVVAPDGSVSALYRKIHLFDVEVGGLVYRESEAEEPGDEPVVTQVEDWPVGLTVCYDIRFPELYRVLALEGAELVTVPANFTERTGRDHWEVLIRARAIEDQLFIVAAGQIGDAPPHYRSFGRSMIVDPWGVVLAQAPDTECFVAADLDFARLDEIRAKLPSLEHRRPDAYESGTTAGVA
jgi:deaminated glutathione amidase